ncbi:MAG: hypothetical protein E7675_01590 [Ruminococcaceae bacterium]|nr:hypothetical protein [Oscillospiraceae bacterium]
MKKLRKLFSSNKGNATYYVMVVIMVITIMVSGLLAVSLRSSVVSTNYKTDIESYNKCDSALQKIKGELKIALVGLKVESASSLGPSSSMELFAPVLDISSHYYPIANGSLCVNAILNDPSVAVNQTIIVGETLANSEQGFLVDESQVLADTNRYLLIKDVTAQDGSIAVKTDIKIIIDKNDDNKVTDVVFENYKIISVTAEGGDQQ